MPQRIDVDSRVRNEKKNANERLPNMYADFADKSAKVAETCKDSGVSSDAVKNYENARDTRLSNFAKNVEKRQELTETYAEKAKEYNAAYDDYEKKKDTLNSTSTDSPEYAKAKEEFTRSEERVYSTQADFLRTEQDLAQNSQDQLDITKDGVDATKELASQAGRQDLVQQSEGVAKKYDEARAMRDEKMKEREKEINELENKANGGGSEKAADKDSEEGKAREEEKEEAKEKEEQAKEDEKNNNEGEGGEGEDEASEEEEQKSNPEQEDGTSTEFYHWFMRGVQSILNVVSLGAFSLDPSQKVELKQSSSQPGSAYKDEKTKNGDKPSGDDHLKKDIDPKATDKEKFLLPDLLKAFEDSEKKNSMDLNPDYLGIPIASLIYSNVEAARLAAQRLEIVYKKGRADFYSQAKDDASILSSSMVTFDNLAKLVTPLCEKVFAKLEAQKKK